MKTKKTIIITGTSSGLGKALFDTLHASGARLICISRTFSDQQTALAGDDTVLLTCDLSNNTEVLSLTKKLREMLREARDIVFIDNAATIKPIGSVGQLDESLILTTTHTNFVAPMLLANALASLENAERVSFIYVTTGAAKYAITGWALYCATKTGIDMFYKVVQEQYKDDKRISVHAFNPGVIDTPMQSQIRESSDKDFPRVKEYTLLHKMQKLSDPASVAKKLIEQYRV
jgi:benzil reductase ((S)-benzoin forming)